MQSILLTFDSYLKYLFKLSKDFTQTIRQYYENRLSDGSVWSLK